MNIGQWVAEHKEIVIAAGAGGALGLITLLTKGIDGSVEAMMLPPSSVTPSQAGLTSESETASMIAGILSEQSAFLNELAAAMIGSVSDLGTYLSASLADLAGAIGGQGVTYNVSGFSGSGASPAYYGGSGDSATQGLGNTGDTDDFEDILKEPGDMSVSPKSMLLPAPVEPAIPPSSSDGFRSIGDRLKSFWDRVNEAARVPQPATVKPPAVLPKRGELEAERLFENSTRGLFKAQPRRGESEAERLFSASTQGLLKSTAKPRRGEEEAERLFDQSVAGYVQRMPRRGESLAEELFNLPEAGAENTLENYTPPRYFSKRAAEIAQAAMPKRTVATTRVSTPVAKPATAVNAVASTVSKAASTVSKAAPAPAPAKSSGSAATSPAVTAPVKKGGATSTKSTGSGVKKNTPTNPVMPVGKR